MNALKTIALKAIETKYTDVRLGFGILFLRVFGSMALLRTHGFPKLLDFQGTLSHIPDPMGLGQTFSAYYAVFANVFCAVLIMLGMFTRLATFAVLSITLSGLFIVHATDPAKVQDIPLIYSIVFITLLILGSGRFSIDALLEKRFQK